MTSVQASLYLIANMPPRFWYDRFCTDYHVTVWWHTILSINRINKGFAKSPPMFNLYMYYTLMYEIT